MLMPGTRRPSIREAVKTTDRATKHAICDNASATLPTKNVRKRKRVSPRSNTGGTTIYFPPPKAKKQRIVGSYSYDLIEKENENGNGELQPTTEES